MKAKNKTNQCKNCLKIFGGISDLKRHEQRKKKCQKREECLQSSHMTLFQQSLVKSTFFQEKLSFCCEWCGKRFSSQRSLTNHDVKAHPLAPIAPLPFLERNQMKHITGETVLKVFQDGNLYKGMGELIRLVYFNEAIPENCIFTIVYPKNENGAIIYNFKKLKFERGSSIPIIKEKVQIICRRLDKLTLESMQGLDKSSCQYKCLQQVLDLGFEEELDEDGDRTNLFYLLNYLQSFCFSKRDVSFRVWHQKGFDGKEFSLNFGKPIHNQNEIKLI